MPEIKQMLLLPPAPHLCQICAVKHKPEAPHNRDSLYYQMKFHMEQGRWPTWADALAHCEAEVQQIWREALAEHGVEVS